MKKIKCKCCNKLKPKSEFRYKYVFNTVTSEIRPTLNSRMCNSCRNKDSNVREKLKRQHPKVNHNICECCKNDISEIGTGKLVFDHDKNTNKFRGWLCESCNTGIGKLGDSVEGLEKALDYLKNSNKTINYKPSKIMNTNKLDLIKYFVDNGEYEYASKTLNEFNSTSTKITVEKLDTSDLPANKRPMARKKYIEKYLKPYNPELNLPQISDALSLVNPYSFVNRSDQNIMDYVESGSLYQNPKGTQDWCFKQDNYDNFILLKKQ